MKNAPWIWTAVSVVAMSLPAAAQDAPAWTETRFHRVYLTNGNFIDGYLVQESDNSLTFKIIGGEIGIRKDAVERNKSGKLRVELIKIRSYKEAPKLEPISTSRPVAAPAATAAPAAAPASDVTVETVNLTGTVAEQVEQARAVLKEGVLARTKGVIDTLGRVEGTAPFLAEIFPTVEDGLVPSVSTALQSLKDTSVLSRVIPLLGHMRAVVREQAALVVGAIGSAKENGPRVRELLADEDPQVRGSAIVALRMLGDFDSFDRVAEFLAVSDKGIRFRAITTLREFAERGGLMQKFTEALTRAIQSADDESRKDLVEEAGKLGAEEMGPVLTRLTVDPDPMIRAHAILGIARIGSQKYVPLIMDRLEAERDYWPRIQLAGAVQMLRIEAGIDPLIEWLSDSDSNIRAAALRALRGISRMNFGGDRESWAQWRDKTRRN
jgi:HEAT repeat protein